MASEVGRLAFRHEGAFWNAYWAHDQDSMDKAVLMGSIRMNTVRGRVREDFLVLMQAAFSNMVEDVTGQTPTWSQPTSAPESERSGHG